MLFIFIFIDWDIFLIPCFKCRQSDLKTSSHSSLTLSTVWLFLVYGLSCVCGTLFFFVIWLKAQISMDNLWICVWVLFKNCILSYYFTQDQVQWVWIGIHVVGSTVFLFLTVVFLLAICLCISCCFTHLGCCVYCFLFLVAIFFFDFFNCGIIILGFTLNWK